MGSVHRDCMRQFTVNNIAYSWESWSKEENVYYSYNWKKQATFHLHLRKMVLLGYACEPIAPSSFSFLILSEQHAGSQTGALRGHVKIQKRKRTAPGTKALVLSGILLCEPLQLLFPPSQENRPVPWLFFTTCAHMEEGVSVNYSWITNHSKTILTYHCSHICWLEGMGLVGFDLSMWVRSSQVEAPGMKVTKRQAQHHKHISCFCSSLIC